MRLFNASEWETYRDLRLRALRDSPDAFGTTLAQARRRSDAHWRSRLRAAAADNDLPLLGEIDGVPAGLAWGRIEPADPEVVHVLQMWVSAQHRSQGLGRKLLNAAIDWARRHGARRVVLAVTCGNSAAQALYTTAGFEPVGEPQPLRPGSALMAQTMTLAVAGSATRATPS